MKRRRLVLAVVVLALVVAVAAWWSSADGLTAEERRLVGTWVAGHHPAFGAEVYDLRPDRRWRHRYAGADGGRDGPRWSVRGGRLVLDFEPSPVRRALRPAELVGFRFLPAPAFRLVSVSADELQVERAGGGSTAWTRAPAD